MLCDSHAPQLSLTSVRLPKADQALPEPCLYAFSSMVSLAKRIASRGGLHVKAVQSEDTYFDASQHLGEVAEFVRAYDASGQGRDLESLDVFAGEGNFERVCQENNIRCEGVEIKRDPIRQNLLCSEGFNYMLHLVLRVVAP